MNVEVIRGDNTQRERWEFELNCSFFGSDEIRWGFYTKESKRPRQRIWRRDGYWSRLFQRDMTIKNPPLPLDVVSEMREEFSRKVIALPMTH